MSQLRRQMIEDLTLADYAESTTTIYLAAIQTLAKHFGRSPARLSRGLVDLPSTGIDIVPPMLD